VKGKGLILFCVSPHSSCFGGGGDEAKQIQTKTGASSLKTSFNDFNIIVKGDSFMR